LSLGIQSLSPT